MIVDNRIRDALDLHNLTLPANPVVVGIEAEDYTNWMGEDALRVNVTLAEDTVAEKISGRDVIDLKTAIYDSLLAHGVTLYPYIFLRRAGADLHNGDDD